MPTFGTLSQPVRNHPAAPININSPEGFMTDPPGDLWWMGLHDSWQRAVPPSVTRATAIIVNPLIRLPWLIDRVDGSQLAAPDPGYPSWLRDPTGLNGASHFHIMERMPEFELWLRWVRSALLLGMGLVGYVPEADNRTPRAGSFQLLNPLNLQVDTYGDWHYVLGGTPQLIDPQTGQVTLDGARVRLVPLRHSLPNGVFGLHREQLALANRLTGYAAESLDSAVPSGVLTTDQPINMTQADEARQEWRTTQASRTIAVLGNGAKYQQVLMSPVEAEIVELSRLSNEQVAHMFELAAWNLDAGTNSLTYSTARDNRQELVDGALASWSARVEETLTALLPRGWRLHIDFTRYTTPTTPTPEGGGQYAASDPAGE
jgi:hypothetical protein